MNVKTYRARTMQEALSLVRRELGPEAAVLHTREVREQSLWGWLRGARCIEVTASTSVSVPSRFQGLAQTEAVPPRDFARPVAPSPAAAPRAPFAAPPPPIIPPPIAPPPRDDLHAQLQNLQSMVENLMRRSVSAAARQDMPESLFSVFTMLLDAEFGEELARNLIGRLQQECSGGELVDSLLMRARVARMIEEEIGIAGPIAVTPGRRRLVALVGPTGVGKTTTIAKLAANFRLKEKRRVGLITVDTYRIAAVEQLRTYADIIDLPMEVVSTPREMRQALVRLSDLDLVLMDTAGRSPKDEIRIQELRAMLAEAAPDEVYLVLGAVASAAALSQTAERFSSVGVTSIVLTKLDETTGLGNLLPLFRSCRLPLSYLTCGQRVPDDIETADRGRLARLMLGMEACQR